MLLIIQQSGPYGSFFTSLVPINFIFIFHTILNVHWPIWRVHKWYLIFIFILLLAFGHKKVKNKNIFLNSIWKEYFNVEVVFMHVLLNLKKNIQNFCEWKEKWLDKLVKICLLDINLFVIESQYEMLSTFFFSWIKVSSCSTFSTFKVKYIKEKKSC